MNLKRLIENNSISFNDLLLQNYHELSLNETETILLMHMHNMINKTGHFDEKELLHLMSISEKDINTTIAKLMAKNLIEYLNADNIIFDNLYQKLDELMTIEEIRKTPTDEIIEYLQVTLSKPLLANDLEIIKEWTIDKISLDEIKKATLIALANNKTSVSYIDRIIMNNHHEIIEPIDERTKAILRNINVK